ncbi:hypothetical protein ACLB2K_026278 [Fragaria x ananassa]
MDIASLENFHQKQIKVGATTGALGDSVSVTCEKNKITVTSDSTFSNVLICVEFNCRDGSSTERKYSKNHEICMVGSAVWNYYYYCSGLFCLLVERLELF